MQFLLLGLIALWLLVLLGRGTVRANPAMLAGLIRNGGGILTLVGVALAVTRGQLPLGGLLFTLALWLFSGAKRPMTHGFGFKSARTAGQGQSHTASSWLDMQIDLASGAISGRVLQGAFAGRDLDGLSQQECAALHQVCLGVDPEGARLLETYFDRRFAGWRQAGNADGDARQRGGSEPRRSAGMSEQEAYQIVGIEKGAAAAQISGAHRALMKKCHPDHGGSAAQAARVNEARDVLMRRHK